MSAKRFTPRKKVRVDLTPLEAQMVLDQLDHRAEQGCETANEVQALRRAKTKIGTALLHAGGAKVGR